MWKTRASRCPVALLLVLISLPVFAQNQNWATCASDNPDLSIGACTTIIQSGKETPENLAKAFNNRGRSYDANFDSVRAIQDYSQAILLKPDFVLAIENRAKAYEGSVDWDHAIKDYSEVIRLKPDDAFAFQHRGFLYSVAKGDYTRSLEDLDQAIRLKPGDADAFETRASVYLFKGDYDRALHDYNQYFSLNPHPAFAFEDFRSRGWVKFYLGQFSEASEDFRKVLESDAQNSKAALADYLAQGRAGKLSLTGLQNQAPKLNLDKWPGAVVKFYLGSGTPDAVLTAATNKDAEVNRRFQCEAYFYLGENALLHGQRQQALDLFQKAVATGVATASASLECAGAQAELKRLSASHDTAPR